MIGVNLTTFYSFWIDASNNNVLEYIKLHVQRAQHSRHTHQRRRSGARRIPGSSAAHHTTPHHTTAITMSAQRWRASLARALCTGVALWPAWAQNRWHLAPHACRPCPHPVTRASCCGLFHVLFMDV